MRNTSRDLSVERKQPVSKTRAQPGIAIEERMLNLILLRSHVGAQRSCSGRAGLARPVWNRDGIPPLPGARLFGIRGLMLRKSSMRESLPSGTQSAGSEE